MSDLVMPQSFPENDYTPHGYIDNPHHSMIANRSGVIRSVPPLGFGYWRRNFKGAYTGGAPGQVNYLSLLHMALAVGETRLTSVEDFDAAQIMLSSKYHTKHVISYDFVCEGLAFSFKYFLSRENALACRIDVTNPNSQNRDVALHATNIYGLWTARWWGSNGLAARHVADSDAAVSTIWAYGDYFALGADGHSAAFKATTSEDEWRGWLKSNNLSSNDGATCSNAGPMYAVQSYKLPVPAKETASLLIVLARGTNEPWALEELSTALRQSPSVLESQLDEDEAFWSMCPQLVGDWPEIWKRGWVYDFETLRMNVREPLGIFRHRWDAMQVHAPRSVLAEASVDMFALSYADSDAAREVMFGTFADAPMDNIPCTREDGGMNMIAADGCACGTAPSWCFPFATLYAIYAATGDVEWVTQLYPYLKRYLEWWFANRTDEDGWFHCKCDWESGQDGSKRFPVDEGCTAEFVRTVDVEAGVAGALRVMELFARVADEPEDAPYWRKMAEKRAAAVREMFVDGWYYDVDQRTGQPIKLDYMDIMMLSPLATRVASHEQIEAIRPKFQHFRDNPTPFLEWPSFFEMYSEAAWTARLQVFNAENIADIADRIYERNDMRTVRMVDKDEPFSWRIPGTANEFWPVSDEIPPGGEAYGWGATLPMHFIRGFIGFREPDTLPEPEATAETEFLLAPALPVRFRVAGKRLGLRNLSYRDVSFDISYEVLGQDRLRVVMECETVAPGRFVVTDENDAVLCEAKFEHPTGELSFEGENGAVYRVRFQTAK